MQVHVIYELSQLNKKHYEEFVTPIFQNTSLHNLNTN
jgi:hypothetical protein